MELVQQGVDAKDAEYQELYDALNPDSRALVDSARRMMPKLRIEDDARQAAAAIREHGLGLKAATVTPEGRGDIGSPNRILREVVEDMRRSPNLESAAPLVVTKVEAALHPEFVALLLRRTEDPAYRPLATVPPAAAAGRMSP